MKFLRKESLFDQVSLCMYVLKLYSTTVVYCPILVSFIAVNLLWSVAILYQIVAKFPN